MRWYIHKKILNCLHKDIGCTYIYRYMNSCSKNNSSYHRKVFLISNSWQHLHYSTPICNCPQLTLGIDWFSPRTAYWKLPWSESLRNDHDVALSVIPYNFFCFVVKLPHLLKIPDLWIRVMSSVEKISRLCARSHI